MTSATDSGHHYSCHVRFSDVDVYGHVNNVKYFEYYQEARIDFLAVMRAADEPHLATVLARIDVDYKRPILFRPEPYDVHTRVSHVGTSSYRLDSEIRDGERLLSKATAVLVAFDLNAQRSRPLTDQEREALQASLVDPS
ncbi:MAG: thioesterase family protein [Nocardioides sp.]